MNTTITIPAHDLRIGDQVAGMRITSADELKIWQDDFSGEILEVTR